LTDKNARRWQIIAYLLIGVALWYIVVWCIIVLWR